MGRGPSARWSFNEGNAAYLPGRAIILLVVAGVLYVAMLMTVRTSANGDAAFGAAVAWFFYTAALWLALTILLLVGAGEGRMPRKAASSLILLQPLAAAALIVSGDFYSRHRHLAPLEPALLPLLIAAYAVWARFPSKNGSTNTGPLSIMITLPMGACPKGNKGRLATMPRPAGCESTARDRGGPDRKRRRVPRRRSG
jgi:hypothetical protein